MRQGRGYSKAIMAGGRPERRFAGGRSAPPAALAKAEEIIVASTLTKYTRPCESAELGLSSGGVATQIRFLGNRVAAAPCRSAGLCRSYQPKPSVFVDATPKKKSRDAMISNTPGFPTHSFRPHSTASPAVFRTAAAARLGVLPEWQSACLSTPPTPKRLG
jgi:hypothetical protein